MPSARVLVVDDSVVTRQFLSENLGGQPGIEVVGVAANGRIALAKLDRLMVDVIILDVEMPEMDGLATLRELRRRPTRPRVIMFSAYTTEQARTTVDALALGAEDCVAKPSSLSGQDAEPKMAIQAIVERIRMLAKAKRQGPRISQSLPVLRSPRSDAAGPARAPKRHVDIVAIGASTGGPNALCQLFASLPGLFPVPILIVQHMPVGFTKPFAERLTRESKIPVEEGTEGLRVTAGKAWIAPAGRHMVVRRERTGCYLHLHDDPPVWSCRPAVDVLFESVAAAFPRSALGVIMTGMGEDGKLGSTAISRAGGTVIAQDEQSSIVWGMAGAVANAGLAEAILPLEDLGDEIARRARRSSHE